LKDLILITAHCNTPDKEEILRGLTNDCQQVRDQYDIMIVSHTTIPVDIAEKTDYSFYDRKNELLYDWDMRSKPWFSPDNVREILSIFTGAFNTHLAVWRLFILGNSLAKNLGYQKVHHIEYDARIHNFTEFHLNTALLEDHDAILYRFRRNETVDPILFGSYQAYRIDSLHHMLYDLDETEIKRMIRESSVKSPEDMLDNFLSNGKKVINKSTDDLFYANHFMYSHELNIVTDAAWCLPYYDELTNRLCFIIWNMEQFEKDIDVVIVYNNEKTVKHIVSPGHWYITDLDDYENSKELIVILNGKVRNHFRFDEYREKFKEVSFRRAKSNI
jgi:hypothetical protein